MRAWGWLMVGVLGCGAPAEEAAEVPVLDTAPVEGCADVDDGADASVLELEPDPGCGEALYEARCAACHGAAGEGTDAGPALGDHVPYHSDLELVVVLTQGSGDMPPSELGNQQIADVLGWLRQTFGAQTGSH